MPLSSLLLFAAVYLAAVATPGPGIAAVLARVLARGTAGLPAFLAGFVVGDLAWFALAATGLALVAQSFAGVFLVLKYVGAAYLACLAWRSWTAQAEGEAPAPVRAESGLRLFLGSLALTLGNPKVVLFFLALLPTVVDLDHLGALGMAEIALVLVLVQAVTLLAYALAAARARRLFASPRARRRIDRGAGAVMAGAAVAVATR